MAKKPEPESIMDMFSRLGSEMKLPKLDVEAVLDHHRKNLEALEKSARAGAAGAASLLSRQREMLQDTLQRIADMNEGLRGAGNPQELMSRQADLARKSFETAVKNAGEVADIVRRSGTESLDILRERIREAMEEVRTAIQDRK